jgi:PKHD-type hydroxylase
LQFKLRDTSRFGYYQTFPNAFTGEECDNMVALFSQLPANAALIEDDKAPDLGMRKGTVRWVPPAPRTQGVFHRIARIMVGANHQTWDFRLEGFESSLQFTEYDVEGAHYDWHMDYGPGVARTRKLSISVQLTDPADYDGGNLEFASVNVDDNELRAKGMAIVFPSFLLHRVTPVNRGKRTSLVAWMDGPEYA